MDIGQAFNEYFIRPIADHTIRGYNPVNTIVYGAILLGIAFFVVYPLLDKRGIKFDKKFALALMPYILFGISLRVITSAGLLGNAIVKTPNPFEIGFWTFTPGIWILTFAITILGLGFAKFFEKKGMPFYKTFAGFGLIFSLPVLIFDMVNFTQWPGFFGAVILALVVTYFSIFIVKKILKKNVLNSGLNRLALMGQALDSTATFVAISFFSFSEQHFVSNAIINLHPALFIFVKVALITLILYYVDKEVEGKNFRNFVKVFLVILGFATGGASLLKIGLVM